jgi:hypothetical protein
LSQTEKFSSTQIKGWLEEQTKSVLPPVQARAQKLRDEMQTSLQNLSETSRMLLDNSAKEIEKRNMKVYNRARALNKLARLFVDRLKKVSIPEQVSYDSMNTFYQETQKVFTVIEVDVRNWFPRISPFFIIDRRKFLAVYEKSKISLSTLQEFTNKEYIKTKTLQETFSQIEELQVLEKQYVDCASQKQDLNRERLQLESELCELEKKTAEFKCKSVIEQVQVIDAESEAVNAELKHLLRHMQKPFVKVQAMASQGGGAYLTPDELKLLNTYLDKPFEALASEETSYPMLKEILQKIKRLMDEDKLKIKPEKARKAEQTIEEILTKNPLSTLQNRCKEIQTKKIQLSTSPEMEESKRNLATLQERSEAIRVRKASIEANETVKNNMCAEVLSKIGHRKKTIETNVQTFLGKNIEMT